MGMEAFDWIPPGGDLLNAGSCKILLSYYIIKTSLNLVVAGRGKSRKSARIQYLYRHPQIHLSL